MLEAGVPREDIVGGEVEEEREDGPLLLSNAGTASAEGGEMERLRLWLTRMGARRLVVERRDWAEESAKRSRSER